NRIGLESAKVTTAGSQVEFSGAIEDLQSPHGTFRYQTAVSLPEIARTLRVPELQRGTVELGGNAIWSGGDRLSATGNLHGYNVEYRDGTVRLRDYTADGAVEATPDQVVVKSMRISGLVSGPGNCKEKLWPCPGANFKAEGHIDTVSLRGRQLD